MRTKIESEEAEKEFLKAVEDPLIHSEASGAYANAGTVRVERIHDKAKAEGYFQKSLELQCITAFSVVCRWGYFRFERTRV